MVVALSLLVMINLSKKFPPIFVADINIIYGYNFVAPLMLSLYLMRLRLGLAVIDLVYRFRICTTAVFKVIFISVRCA